MTESPFARWVRRKHEFAKTRNAKISHGEAPAAAQGSLPAVDDIDARTDIRGFLHPGVSPQLRNAALRKAWLADPAIRDFIGPARDYDYDWTRPDGLPAGGQIAAPEPGETGPIAFRPSDEGGHGNA